MLYPHRTVFLMLMLCYLWLLSNLDRFPLVCNSAYLLMGARNIALRRSLRLLPGSQDPEKEQIWLLLSSLHVGRDTYEPFLPNSDGLSTIIYSSLPRLINGVEKKPTAFTLAETFSHQNDPQIFICFCGCSSSRCQNQRRKESPAWHSFNSVSVLIFYCPKGLEYH